MCHKTCIFFFFPIINKYLCMAKRSLPSRCPSYNIFFLILSSRRDSVGGRLRYPRLDNCGTMVRFSAGATDDSLLEIVQTGIGAQPHVQWVLGGGGGVELPPLKLPGHKSCQSPSMPRFRMSGTIHPLPDKSSWREQAQLYFTLFPP